MSLSDGDIPAIDRGIDRWWQAVEIDAFTADRLRIKQRVRWGSESWRIVGISRIKPLHEGGVVVRLEGVGANGVAVTMRSNEGIR